MTRPLVHFLALGLLLFVTDRLWTRARGDAAASPPPVVISAQRFEQLRSVASARTGRALEAAQLEALVDAEVADELLYRQALAYGFDRDDPVVFNRLVQNMRFAGADPERAAQDLYEDARELGMHRSDLVVRRRLIQRMRLLLESRVEEPSDSELRQRMRLLLESRVEEPSDSELRAYFEAQAEELLRPARLRLTQIFFTQQHADTAARALEGLTSRGLDPATALGPGGAPGPVGALGDPFLHASAQPPQSEQELARRFGAEFARAVFALDTGRWSGPVASAYGVHLVWIHERSAPELPPFEEVRAKLRYGLLAERGAEAVAAALAELRRGVEVRVESPST
jgi:hypothetical protein